MYHKLDCLNPKQKNTHRTHEIHVVRKSRIFILLLRLFWKQFIPWILFFQIKNRSQLLIFFVLTTIRHKEGFDLLSNAFHISRISAYVIKVSFIACKSFVNLICRLQLALLWNLRLVVFAARLSNSLEFHGACTVILQIGALQFLSFNRFLHLFLSWTLNLSCDHIFDQRWMSWIN